MFLHSGVSLSEPREREKWCIGEKHYGPKLQKPSHPNEKNERRQKQRLVGFLHVIQAFAGDDAVSQRVGVLDGVRVGSAVAVAVAVVVAVSVAVAVGVRGPRGWGLWGAGLGSVDCPGGLFKALEPPRGPCDTL